MKKEKLEKLYFTDYPAFIHQIVNSAIKKANKEDKIYKHQLKGNTILITKRDEKQTNKN